MREIVVACSLTLAMCNAFLVFEVAMAVRCGGGVTTGDASATAMGQAVLSVSDVVPARVADAESSETMNEGTARDSASRPTSAKRYLRERGSTLVQARRPNAARKFLEWVLPDGPRDVALMI